MKLARALFFAVVGVVVLSCGDGGIRKKNEPDPIPDPKCGDGRVDPGEECDGSDLNGQSCTTLGFDLGTVSCDATCKLVTSQCTRLCGDGRIGPGEECDGTQGPLACGDWGYKACTSSCKVERIHCKTSTFLSGTPLQLTPGGRSVLTDLAPRGYGDLVTAVPDFFRVQTHAYDMTKGFTPGRTFSRMNDSEKPLLPIAGDFDGDGNNDVAGINADGTVDRYRYVPPGAGNPTERFVVENLFNRGPPADGGTACRIDRWVGTGELDGEPGAELVALGCDGATATITFDSVFVFPGGAAPAEPRELKHPGMVSATLADFDGDGALDIIAADKPLQLTVFKGPNFGELGPFDLGVPASQLAAADLDGDGDADLVVASGASLKVLENIGGGFAEHPTFAGQSFDLLVRDLDLDGKPDIAWLENGKVELRRNFGPFVFTAFHASTGSGTPLSLSAGDLEGDGDPDLAIAVQPSPGSGNTVIYVLLNQVR